YLDNGNAVNGLMKMNASFMQKFYDKVFDIMEATTDNPTSKEQTAKMKVLTQKMFTAMGDEVSFSYSYAGGMPPFKLQEVVEIKDSSAMKAMVTEGIDYAKSDDPNTMKMQQEIKKVYGDGLKYYLAQSPDKFYITMGQGGEETLKKLIDQPAKSAAPSGDIKIAMDALQNSPYNNLVCSVNVIKLMKGMGEMMQTMGAQTSMGPAAAMFTGLKDVQTQSCLVMGGKVADGQAAMRLGVPKQHLAEIVAIAMQLQMQAAAAQQQMQNAPMPEMSAAPPQSSMQAETAAQNPLTSWIGKPAPDFKMVDLKGNIHRVSRLKGKKIMLDFWATWCPPCKKSIPDLIKLRADSNDSELVIIGLSNEPAETLNSFAENAKINYPIVAYDNVPAPYNQVTGIPTLFLIDSKGVIQDVLVGYHPPEEIQSRLEKIN
ncbi:MAG: TlpA family protein disulfide reductase, partial [Planctomycetota bacterium]